MTELSFHQIALQIAVGAVAGWLTGAAYFSALWWNVGLFESGATPRALALLVLRFAFLVLVFVALAKMSAFALLAGAAGLLFARRLMMRRYGSLE